MSDIVKRLEERASRMAELGSPRGELLTEARDEIVRLRKEVARLKKLDREAATYVESVICMRTRFTGNPPYVGWKGLGLALREELEERDRLRDALQDALVSVLGQRDYKGDRECATRIDAALKGDTP